MRRLPALLLALIAAPLATCAPARATAPLSQDLPFASRLQGCTEPVDVTGTLHLLSKVQLDAAGGYTSRIHANLQHAGGVGVLSGAPYRAQYITNDTIAAHVGGTNEYTSGLMLALRGGGQAFRAHFVAHLVLKDGAVALLRVEGSSSCR